MHLGTYKHLRAMHQNFAESYTGKTAKIVIKLKNKLCHTLPMSLFRPITQNQILMEVPPPFSDPVILSKTLSKLLLYMSSGLQPWKTLLIYLPKSFSPHQLFPPKHRNLNLLRTTYSITTC